MIRKTVIPMAGLNTRDSFTNKMTACVSFSPIADKQATMLILGSMPGVESLRQQQYYAHPRNVFWPIMASLFDLQSDGHYQQRCQQLKQHKVALWDVLQACRRPGSLDQHIEADSIVTNDFNDFLQQHPHIQCIFFNGSKAEQLFKRYVLPELTAEYQQIPMVKLPSTSPAHAAMKFEQKRQIWQQQLNQILMSGKSSGETVAIDSKAGLAK